ncbi:MAG: S-layer homology domain-containing protein [Clostridia bacterium]|nr:S-layer homology domain-containing protein [Clostridia bacterium]
MKKISYLLLCILLMIGTLPVYASGTYDEAAARVASLRIINTQEPSAVLTRGEAIFALMRLYVRGEMSVTGEESVFSDVEKDSTLVPYANYAAHMGFVNGMGDGRLAPDEGISLQQFIKIAVCAIDYQRVAEAEGGYAGGYMAVASRLGILKNVPASQGALTYEHAVLIIDNMLDIHPLEMVYGTDEYKKTELTLYEQLQNNEDLYVRSGLVTAVGKMALSGYSALEQGEISVGGLRMAYDDFDDEALLGRYVTAYYRYGAEDAIPVVVSIHIERRNEEITINARDITKLDASECVYTDENGRNTQVLRFDGVQTIYNGRWYTSPVKPVAGGVTALDYDGDGSYELLFVDEYESFIVDKTLAVIDSIYFEEGFTFRGKNSLSFDFDDDDKEYEFLSNDMSEMSFSDITEGDVVSIWADMNEEKIRVVICREKAEGVLSSKDEEKVGIGATEYYVYEPNVTSFMSKYELGRSGVFALNHAGEIVDVAGELDNRISYGYAIGFDGGNGFRTAQIRLVLPGTKEEKIKKSGNSETVSRIYTNSGIAIFDLNKTVNVYAPDGTKTRKSSSDLTTAQINGAVVGYELDTDGKIKALHNIQTATKNEYDFFNGEIHSYSDGSADAFFVGDSTQVIFVPDTANPAYEDFEEPYTVADGASDNKLCRVAVDSETQIAECMVIFGDPAEQKNFSHNDDDVSVVGKVRVKIGSDGTETYIMEVLTGETVEQVYVESDSEEANVAANLKTGDLIYYRANDDGEVTSIKALLHLSAKIGGSHYVSNLGEDEKIIYGTAQYLKLNYLDILENERVDGLKLNISGERLYKLFRKEGPMFYIYSKSDKLVYPGVPEAIIEGSSEIFLYLVEAEELPAAVVIVKD